MRIFIAASPPPGHPKPAGPRNCRDSNEPRMTLVHLILPNLTIGKFYIVMHAVVAAIRDTSLNKLWGCARRAAMANQARTFAYGRQLLVRYHHVIDAMFDWLPNALWVLVSSHVKMRPR